MNSTKKPLRVAQLVLSLAIGGTEKLVYDIVRRTDPEAVSHIVYCLNDLGEFGDSLAEEGYRIGSLNRQPGIDWQLIRRFSAILRHDPVDVIHAHHYTPFFYAAMTAMFCRISGAPQVPKIVFTEHGIFYPYRRNPKHFVINPFLCRMADELITIAEYTKRNLIKYENYPEHRLKVLYNGIDLDAFSDTADADAKKKELGLSPRDKAVGIVARLDPVKNHAVLFRAFARLLEDHPNTFLVVAGDGPEKETLKSLAGSLGISENVRFLGARRDIPELLCTFDIFVLPSYSEGMSITLLEAMAAGLPIVATRVGGNPEVLIDRETGFLIPDNDEKMLAEKLKHLLNDGVLCEKMGKAGRKRVEDLFSLEKMIREYVRLYYKVCGLEAPV